jgi:DNA-binding PadR family transcriptional regulator
MIDMSASGVEEQELALDSSAYVVLGMVGLGARSGYEIKRAVELSIRFFWTVSHAQIYPSLRRLERAGLVRGRAEPRGRRPRRLYEITARGRGELRRWLSREDPMPFELRDLGMVKLFFADSLSERDAAVLLDAVRRRSEERVRSLRALEGGALAARAQGNAHPLLTLRMGIAVHRAMIEAAEEFAAGSRRT